jgi:flagellar basal-body rod modification protein FlgD
MGTVTSALAASGTSSTPDVSTAQGLEQTANKETFLKLLVAQIRNQDPLNPTDGTEFLTQLAQFSQLEQLMNIRSDIEALTTQLAATTAQAESNDTAA